MGWFDYYRLLEKYQGNLSKATEEEMLYAAKCNPNNPPTARAIAEEHYNNDQQYKAAIAKAKKD